MFGIAYIITNSINDKCYVGITTTTIKKRWTKHMSDAKRGRKRQSLHAAIRKYGADKFQITEIASSWDEESLFQLEDDLIEQEQTLSPLGYNLVKGFGRVSCSDETRERLRQSTLGQKCSPETKAKLSAISSVLLKGRPVSEETRKKIGDALRGKKRSPEVCAKMSASRLGKPTGRSPMKGRKHSAETKAKMSLSQTGREGPNKGKKLPPEVGRKISAALKGRKHTPEHIAKRAATRRGTKLTDEQRQNISIGHLGQTPWNKGKTTGITPMKGRQHSEETKAKISAAKREGFKRRQIQANTQGL